MFTDEIGSNNAGKQVITRWVIEREIEDETDCHRESYNLRVTEESTI